MKAPRSAVTAWIYFLRSLRLRCPACGIKPLFVRWYRVRSFHDWFTPLDGCPVCGYPYEREQGYFLMAIWAVNYGVASVLGLTLYFLLETFFDLPVGTLIAAVIAPIFCFSILFARHAKAFFLAADLFLDPHSGGGGDDGGNKPGVGPDPAGGPSKALAVEPCESAGTLQ